MLTVARRHVFSLSAPTHPVNPMINVTVPATEEKLFELNILR